MALHEKTALRILPAAVPGQMPVVRELFREYEAFIGVDLCFQEFAREVAGLPGDYGPPRGLLLLAWVDDALAGCVALRPQSPQHAEMKRLFVRPQFHSRGVGRALAEELIRRARALGYAAIRLDTLPSMRAAQGMYEAMGFRDIAPYCANPVAGARYMELQLSEMEQGRMSGFPRGNTREV
jgi:ribosomal protein S18 acetylase RimI-like enzyme